MTLALYLLNYCSDATDLRPSYALMTKEVPSRLVNLSGDLGEPNSVLPGSSFRMTNIADDHGAPGHVLPGSFIRMANLADDQGARTPLWTAWELH